VTARDRLCARTPVADELLDHCGGEEEFCRRIVGKVVETVQIDRQASREAPLTVEAPVVVVLPRPWAVLGPGYAKVAAAHPIRPTERIEGRAVTYVCVCYEPLVAGEAATDTSRCRWP
jgi:hypothetical protein